MEGKITVATVHKLSNRQERALLKLLKSSTPIASGSSRLVYNHPLDKNKVIKVGVGANAFRQNRLEIASWKKFGHEGFLARIYDYGAFIIVMEKMSACFTDDDYPSGRSEEFFNCERQVKRMLGGPSADNYQIGISSIDDELRCYDYGFCPGVDSRTQIGWANDLLTKVCEKYLDLAYEILKQKKPINTVEHSYRKLAYDF